MTTRDLQIVTILVSIIFIAFVVYRSMRDKEQPLAYIYHVPDDVLADFSLNAFVLAPDHLYIENANAQTVFDGPVQCTVSRDHINVKGGPDFLERSRAEYI